MEAFSLCLLPLVISSAMCSDTEIENQEKSHFKIRLLLDGFIFLELP